MCYDSCLPPPQPKQQLFMTKNKINNTNTQKTGQTKVRSLATKYLLWHNILIRQESVYIYNINVT